MKDEPMGKVRVSMDIDRDVYAKIEDLAEASEMTIEKVFNVALESAVRGMLVDHKVLTGEADIGKIFDQVLGLGER